MGFRRTVLQSIICVLRCVLAAPGQSPSLTICPLPVPTPFPYCDHHADHHAVVCVCISLLLLFLLLFCLTPSPVLPSPDPFPPIASACSLFCLLVYFVLLYFSSSYCPHIINSRKSIYLMNTSTYPQQSLLESLHKYNCLWNSPKKTKGRYEARPPFFRWQAYCK